MGHAYTMVCRNCNHKQELYEGWGMAGLFTENKLIYLDKDTQEKILKQIQLEDVSKQFISYEVYQCLKCFHLENKQTVSLVFKNGIKFELEFVCIHCHLPMNKLYPIQNELRCPKCAKKVLDFTNFSRWD